MSPCSVPTLLLSTDISPENNSGRDGDMIKHGLLHLVPIIIDECGGGDSNPWTPPRMGPKPIAFAARQPPQWDHSLLNTMRTISVYWIRVSGAVTFPMSR